MPNILYQQNDHLVVTFTDLVKGEGIQSNQLLIKNGHHSALFDPGGDLTYMPLNLAITKFEPIKELDYIIATHQDPDIISSFNKWLMYTDAKVVISKLWERFLPHLIPGFMESSGKGRVLVIPDQGMSIDIGNCRILALPAHFLHSVGNFHFYDPISRILFSGDVGASLVDSEPERPVQDFDQHINAMLGFHRRYMTSNKACRLWVNMVRQLDLEMMIPQHGRPFQGREMIDKFLDWFEQLQCGIDLITDNHYQIP